MSSKSPAAGSRRTRCGAADAGLPPCSPRWLERTMTHPEAATLLHDLLDGAESRERWEPEDTKSGARFERVVIAGERYVLKHQDPRDDWLLRATGDPGVRYVRLWEHGLLDRLPDVVDSAVVAAAFDGTMGMILLRD